MLKNPPIQIFDITVLEPVTTVTDLAVSAVCLYAFFTLRKLKTDNNAYRLFNYFFLSMGIATAIGGIIGHGFIYLFSFAWKLPGWLTSMISIWLLERASIEYAKHILNPRLTKIMKVANIVELLTFMTITFYTLNFHYVEIHSAFGLLVINLPLHSYVYVRTKSQASKIMLIAIGFSLLSATVFKTGFTIDQWFNHFDLSHTLMAISAFVFYKAAKYLLQPPQIKLPTK